MTAKCVVDTSSRPAPRTLLQLFQKITHFLTYSILIEIFA